MRITPEKFRCKALVVHAFLADVPLHDVWAIHLKGGGEGRTMCDFQALLRSRSIGQINPIVKGLFALRRALGRVFGWDDEKQQALAISYVHRLCAADRARSLTEPGTLRGAFCIVYEFDNEALAEIINGTVHAFALTTIEPAPGGYTVYLAVYVKKINWLTPFYMALIDPFRRMFVYPALIRQLQRAWATRYGSA